MNDLFEIRLEVELGAAGYEARWVEESGKAGETFQLELPLTAADAADLRWYLEKFRGFVGAGTRVKARNVESRMEEWGRRFFAACFGEPHGSGVWRAAQEARDAGRPVILTLASNESRIHQQPWELIRGPNGLLVLEGLAFRRQLAGEQPKGRHPPREAGAPLRLLLIVARPDGAGFIDPRSSLSPLLDALDQLPFGAVQLARCEPPTLARLGEMVAAAREADEPYHLVHFDGHGTFLPVTGMGVVAFEKADRGVDKVPGSKLGELLARLEVSLVILEACRSSTLSDLPVYGSVAPALLASGVGSVVAFSHTVAIDASRILVERFYRELVDGRSVGQALAGARLALREEPRRLHAERFAATVDFEDWFLPQLYQSGEDPVLLTEPEDRTERPEGIKTEERLYFFPPPPLYPFHGRAWELIQIERIFERYPALLLTGGGGMGKTALAREAAFWWLRTGRFDEAVFVSFEQPTNVERVVQELGRALEGPSFSSRRAEDQESTALRLFRERKVLLVWDNFDSTLPQFQEGEEGGIVAYPEEERTRLHRFYERLTEKRREGRLLVTCRPADAGLTDIRQQPLLGLARHDSLHLVQTIADMRVINLDRPGWEPEEMEKLLDLLADHPLSIALVAPSLRKLDPKKIRDEFLSLIDLFADEEGELRASLAYSSSKLKPPAQAALPFLAFFQGGAFEPTILNFTGLNPRNWSEIRSELEGLALLRTETIPQLRIPYIRLHPALPYLTRRDPQAEEHFVAVYLDLWNEVADALRRSAAAAGLALVQREEANLRSALAIAFRLGENQAGVELADTLLVFLQMSARLRERDQLAEWVDARMPGGGRLDVARCATIYHQALALAARSKAEAGADLIRRLIVRLEGEGLAESADLLPQLGTALGHLGRIWESAGRPHLAVEPLLRSICILENLPGDEIEANLAAALGDLANSCRSLGRLGEALDAAQRGLAINRRLGRKRSEATSLGSIAAILAEQERWIEAENFFQDAFDQALGLGDREVQAIVLQHQGSLRLQQGNPGRAAELYEQSSSMLQKAGDLRGEMMTCGLLAAAERQRDELDAAEAWHNRTRELAERLGDRAQIGAVAHNLGVLYRDRAERAGTSEERKAWLQRALTSLQEGFAIHQERKDRVNMATSYFQLGVVHYLIGYYICAEHVSRQALKLRQELGDPDLAKTYFLLAKIAAARGNDDAAAEWAAKRDASLAEVEARRSGKANEIDLEQIAGSLLAVARAVYESRATRSQLDPRAAEDVESLLGLPSPLAEVGRFLRAVAAGEPTPTIPTALPAQLREICQGLAEAVSGLPR